MIAIVSALLSGACFHFSTGLGGVWPLAWLAPIPVLWLAYGEGAGWKVFAAAFAGFLLGELNLFEAYAVIGVPLAVLIAGLALAFAACTMFGRWAVRRLPPLAGAMAFPAIWTGWDYVLAMVSPHGAFASLANSQVGAPILIQGAALFGPWIVTFLICAVASLTALSLRQPARAGLIRVAVVLFGLNLAFGAWRLNHSSSDTSVRVAATADDRLGKLAWTADAAHATAATRGYAERARALAGRGAQVIVLPEKFAFLTPDYRAQALAPLQQVADDTGATIVAGFDDKGTRTNEALVLRPHSAPFAYAKRHLIPGLETGYVRGDGTGLIDPGSAVAICKDMDFPQTLRADARKGFGLLLVPAWDFDSDGWSHARMAILRGVEGGYAVVRAAQHGLATVSDAQGRVIARASSATGGAAVAAVAPGTGDTLYVRIGDVFAWLCLVATLILALAGGLGRGLALTSGRSSV